MPVQRLKKKQLVKRAFKEPEKYTPAELTYMKLWNKERKRRKRMRRNLTKLE
jgi:hypothetical protein